MICPNCKYENVKEAKYCTECGTKLEVIEEEKPAVEEQEGAGTEQQETIPPTQWHYVKGEESVGPISQEEMQQLIQNKEINENTYVWKEGMEDWILLRDSEFMQSMKEWYYAQGKESVGPFTRSQMIEFLHDGIIHGNTYVWKKGMEDWTLLKNSELIDQSASPLQHDIPQSKKNIVLQVVLSVVTCGIYMLCWFYTLAEDINSLCRKQGQKEPFEPVLVVILSVITCGLYGIYFFWKAGKSVAKLQYDDYTTGDDSALLAIVAIFAAIVSCAILQNTLNEIADHAE